MRNIEKEKTGEEFVVAFGAEMVDARHTKLVITGLKSGAWIEAAPV